MALIFGGVAERPCTCRWPEKHLNNAACDSDLFHLRVCLEGHAENTQKGRSRTCCLCFHKKCPVSLWNKHLLNGCLQCCSPATLTLCLRDGQELLDVTNATAGTCSAALLRPDGQGLLSRVFRTGKAMCKWWLKLPRGLSRGLLHGVKTGICGAGEAPVHELRSSLTPAY